MAKGGAVAPDPVVCGLAAAFAPRMLPALGSVWLVRSDAPVGVDPAFAVAAVPAARLGADSRTGLCRTSTDRADALRHPGGASRYTPYFCRFCSVSGGANVGRESKDCLAPALATLPHDRPSV